MLPIIRYSINDIFDLKKNDFSKLIFLLTQAFFGLK